jgi:hypothetical protein
MLIYTEHITPRLNYIVDELFARRLGIKAMITTSVNEVVQYKGAKVNYSHHTIEGCLHIRPHAILFDNHIHNYAISVMHHNEWDTIFWQQNDIIPFDILAASFYLLTRYEEYLPHKVDEHDRFDPEQSLAVEYGFLETPIIDKWVLKLKEMLEQQFGELPCKLPSYRFVSSIDIDTAYLYKGLEHFRQLRKTIKSASLLRFDKLAEQVNVLHRNLKDPYDTFDYIHQTVSGKQLLYFVLCGGENEYDEAIPIQNEEMLNLLGKLHPRYELCLHPSYDTISNDDLIKEQKLLLENIIKRPVVRSRQHFLRLRLPITYQLLLENGITHDYSMAYGAYCGFRASTAHPFYFFNLEENKVTPLLVHPVCIMDTTMRYGMNLTVQAAIQKVEQLIYEIKQVNGTLVSIWHNSNLSETNGWMVWKEVFERLHLDA